MSERSIVITENDGNYQIHNSVLNEFELLGILEYIVFDLKYSKSQTGKPENSSETKESESKETIGKNSVVENSKESTSVAEVKDAAKSSVSVTENMQEAKKETSPVPKNETAPVASASTPDVRTRVGNAVKAIRDLGGRVEDVDLGKMSVEELQTELEELTAQYKRLKNSRSKTK